MIILNRQIIVTVPDSMSEQDKQDLYEKMDKILLDTEIEIDILHLDINVSIDSV